MSRVNERGDMRAYLCRGAFVCLIAPMLFIQSCGGNNNPPPSRNNVLFIFVDDLRTTLGSYGDPLARSPNMDRLAGEGIKFENAFCQFPLCNPSRTSCLSGLRPESTKVIKNTTNPRTKLPDRVFLPEYFKANGYFTARVGKIEHNAWPNIVSWDQAEDDPENPGEEPGNIAQLPGWEASNLKDRELPDGQIAHRAIELLRENKGRTFFLGVGFRRPHRPLVAPKKYFQFYNINDITLPPEALAEGDVPLKSKQEVVLAYYACVSFVDAQIGLVLDELSRLGLRDRTFVVLVSDHGVDLGERNRFVYKHSLYDNIVRVPMMLSGPGLPRGVTLSNLVELVDLYPTLADLCELPQPAGMEGLSMAGILRDPDSPWRSAAFMDDLMKETPSKGARTNRYKYISEGNGQELLFDLSLDPKETSNLAADPNSRKVLTEMRDILRQGWRAAAPRLAARPGSNANQ